MGSKDQQQCSTTTSSPVIRPQALQMVQVWTLSQPTPSYTLEGHEKGVNCLDYFTGGQSACMRWNQPRSLAASPGTNQLAHSVSICRAASGMALTYMRTHTVRKLPCLPACR